MSLQEIPYVDWHDDLRRAMGAYLQEIPYVDWHDDLRRAMDVSLQKNPYIDWHDDLRRAIDGLNTNSIISTDMTICDDHTMPLYKKSPRTGSLPLLWCYRTLSLETCHECIFRKMCFLTILCMKTCAILNCNAGFLPPTLLTLSNSPSENEPWMRFP